LLRKSLEEEYSTGAMRLDWTGAKALYAPSSSLQTKGGG
jgi:hypothetical protein